MSNDLINGLFEIGGAALITLSVRKLWIEREMKGFSVWPLIFFTAWGVWNLRYYPSLDQWYSFAGGCAVVAVNTCYLLLIWKVHRDTQAREKAALR